MYKSDHNLSSVVAHDTLLLASRWRNAVRRGDVSENYAADQVAGEITYPYATASHYANVRALALKYVR